MLKLIFLPNKFEKYAAGLRNLFQKLIIKNGISEQYLKNLAKIYEAEAIFIKQQDFPFDLENYLHELLTAIYLKKLIKNQDFEFNINVFGNKIFDKKSFSALILKICQQTNDIEIFEQNKKIVIKTKIKTTEKLLLLVKKFKGQIFCEKKTGNCLIILPFNSTQKTTRDFEDAHTLLQNPLSPVNSYL